MNKISHAHLHTYHPLSHEPYFFFFWLRPKFRYYLELSIESNSQIVESNLFVSFIPFIFFDLLESCPLVLNISKRNL